MAIDLLCQSPKLSYSCKLIKYVPFPINHRPNSLQEVWSFEGDVLLLDISGEIINKTEIYTDFNIICKSCRTDSILYKQVIYIGDLLALLIKIRTGTLVKMGITKNGLTERFRVKLGNEEIMLILVI